MARDKACVVIGAGDATGGAIARRFARDEEQVLDLFREDGSRLPQALGLDLRDGSQAVEGDVVTSGRDQ